MPSPEVDALKKRAEEEAQLELESRLSSDTRALLRRYGALRGFTGSGYSVPVPSLGRLGPLSIVSGAGSGARGATLGRGAGAL